MPPKLDAIAPPHLNPKFTYAFANAGHVTKIPRLNLTQSRQDACLRNVVTQAMSHFVNGTLPSAHR
jgi:hypothetical protein